MIAPGTKLAIMQPYFLPYIGYFQLISAVDKFVVFDDVCYINRGWINRNRMLINGEPAIFTVPLCNSSQNKNISDIRILNDDRWRNKMLQTFRHSYSKACSFKQTYEILESIINFPSADLNAFLLNSLLVLVEYLEIKTDIVPSSARYKNSNLRGQDRILDICHHEQAKVYVNPIGGVELYHHDAFQAKQIKLSFLKAREFTYLQGKHVHQPWLSIIDIMMFNSKDAVKGFLSQYDLVEN